MRGLGLPLAALIVIGAPVRAQEEVAPAKADARAQPPPRAPHARDRWLVQRIDAAIAARPELAPAHLGISVVEVARGRVLYAHDADERLKLASNAKIITALGALSLLGPEYRYRTEILADALRPDGTVAGNLYFRGSGDPSLDTAALWSMVHELAGLGVKKVTGALVIDDTLFDGAALPPVYDEKDEPYAFRASVSAASLNDNAITIRVQPGPAAGAPARVTLDPASRYFVVKSTATTLARGRAALAIATRALEDQTEITVSGTIRLRDLGGRVFRRRVEHPTLYLGATLRALLADARIRVRAPRLRATPPKARVLVTHLSPPVGVLVREMAKTSNNFVAETLLKTIGLEAGGPPGTWAKGLAAVRRRIAELGVPESAYEYDNGSGLYSAAFMGAATMTELLRLAALDFRYGPDLVSAFAIAGADGTLRHRMIGGPAERYVRAKSGSLHGVACLSGYAGGVARPLLAFSVLVNDIPDSWAAAVSARRLADDIAEDLALYLEAD